MTFSRSRTALFVAVAGVVVLVATAAEAHLALLDPPSRYGGRVLKDFPCGRAGGARSTNVVTLAPGSTLTVRWDEYVDHPGHFRIAFDDDGDDDFADPPCLASCDSRAMVIGVAPGDYTDPTVLADGIEDRAGGGEYSYDVTLPDIECDNCTLQVIQVMTDKPPYGPADPDDMYYQCVDLVLSGDAPDGGVVVMDGGTTGDTGTTGGDTGTTGGDTGTTGGDTGTTGGGDDGGCAAAPGPIRSGPLACIALVVFVLGFGRRRR